MSYWPDMIDPATLALACGVAFLGGTVKGLVGFALPMILISGLGTVIAPQLALAGLILPTLVANAVQALRQGPAEAWRSVLRFRRFLIVASVFLALSAQLVAVFPQPVLLVLIGAPVALFCVLQLTGRPIVLPRRGGALVEAGVAAMAGFIGGMSGVWGPPTVAYLTAIGTEKRDQMRVQGVIYGLGSVALLGAHVASGVLRAETAPFSAVLVVPAVAGMWLGARLQDRIDQVAFRRLTLAVLLLAALNLLRRAFLG